MKINISDEDAFYFCKIIQKKYVEKIKESENPNAHLAYLENTKDELRRFKDYLEKFGNLSYNRKWYHWQKLFSKMILKAWMDFKTYESYMKFN